MEKVLQALEDWLREMLVSGVMSNLNGVFDAVNNQVGQITIEVAKSPANFLPAVYNMIRNISENVIMPIAGIILTFIACYELIQLVISHNNLANFETWIFFKWIIKTFIAVTIITNTTNITMAVFDVASHVITQSGGIVTGSTAIDSSAVAGMQSTLEAMELGALFSVFLESSIIKILLQLFSILIFVLVNARMVEIYLTVCLAPIPFATFGNKEQSQMGQNYLKSLFALGFQGFLIMVCVGIYAVLIQSVSFTTDITGSLWAVMGYTVLLCFTLFKTGSIAKSVLHAH